VKPFNALTDPDFSGGVPQYTDERLGELLGRRLTPEQEAGTAPAPIPIDLPCELGFHCPVCEYEHLKDGHFDERLAWSEYNASLWCYVCERDYPSVLCIPLKGEKFLDEPWVNLGIDDAMKVFRDTVEEAKAQGSSDLTFATFSKTQVSRAARWHKDDLEPWSGADWSGALMGEVGEVAEEVIGLFLLAQLTKVSGHASDTVKKLRRLETGAEHIGPERDELTKKLGDELGDVVAYLCNLADHYEIDLAEAVKSKFNEVSDKYGFPERL